MKRLTGRVGNARGFTLIEFAIASAIAGVMFLVLYSILDQALSAYNVGMLRSRAVQNGRVTMVRIVDDLRYAEDIWVADDDRIFVSRPHEGNGTLQLIDYYYNPASDEVTRRINWGANYTFAEQITSFSLTYRDEFFQTITTPVSDPEKPDIRYIEVELRLEEDNYVITLRNLVALENPVTEP